ncbi:cAMP-binding domain of CRP or a regulatory subunit of cAMP-dependent protein kinases [Paracidovorax wautersii]|uniref:cAMP-binding domain of CRP or a regulatory subunit of cAMP-dependent protein kinases n=2 Tax=Paracidovorax wautersii TaxID=1177982 RepID=A0A1I2C3A6_9BURK|nr:cAMP-binding domain of CRP or a regulatory subunit of cAMP-dependent protein kinases [Paracidovorax wautersii]
MAASRIAPAMNAVAHPSVCPRQCEDCGLRRSPAFTPASAAELETIESLRSGSLSVPAGGTLIRERQLNARLYTLYSGWAMRYKTLSDGRRQILNFLLPGDLAGLQQQFGEVSSHGVEAITDCHFCLFEDDALWSLYREHARMGYDVTWLAAREESLVDENLLTTGRRSAPERVAMLLMQLHRRLERLGLTAADGSAPFPINQQHIADALGLSLVHTNKTLRRLAQMGLHELSGGRLRILNARVLARIAEFYDSIPRLAPLL